VKLSIDVDNPGRSTKECLGHSENPTKHKRPHSPSIVRSRASKPQQSISSHKTNHKTNSEPILSSRYLPANAFPTMKLSVFSILLLSVFVALVSGSASADDDKDVVKMGTCTGGGSRSKIELSQDDDNLGRLEVDFDVDTTRPNRVWTVVITRNGQQVYKRNHRTNAWGNFDAEIELAGLTGNITAVATAVSSSEKCTASAKIQ
jgi:hypothetical protein